MFMTWIVAYILHHIIIIRSRSQWWSPFESAAYVSPTLTHLQSDKTSNKTYILALSNGERCFLVRETVEFLHHSPFKGDVAVSSFKSQWINQNDSNRATFDSPGKGRHPLVNTASRWVFTWTSVICSRSFMRTLKPTGVVYNINNESVIFHAVLVRQTSQFFIR